MSKKKKDRKYTNVTLDIVLHKRAVALTDSKGQKIGRFIDSAVEEALKREEVAK